MKLGIIYAILGYSPACLRNQGTPILKDISLQTGKKETFSPPSDWKMTKTDNGDAEDFGRIELSKGGIML